MIEYLFLLLGIVLMISGGLGVLRFPDVYTRLHASTKCDTGGAMSILIALAIVSDVHLLIKMKFLILAFLIAMINPMVAHAIAKGAHKSGIKPEGVIDLYARDGF